ncbi:hypothetical protein J7L02_02710 [Candidatus Woesearchaeota archaeon]|nr:hypothetical protein [Candidatus Woesearchaeota archaeon]
MRVESLYYVFGAILVFAGIVYFSYEYITQFPRTAKLVILILASVVLFFIGEKLREKNV